jgi:hypothetical protein
MRFRAMNWAAPVKVKRLKLWVSQREREEFRARSPKAMDAEK